MDQVIMTTYLTSQKDPQRNRHWPIDDYSIISTWKESIEALKINGIIFYDQLSEMFVCQHKSKYVDFIKCDYDCDWSTNDFRFVLYNQYCSKNKNIEYIFMTDLSDVAIIQNPLDKMKALKFEDKIVTGLDDAGAINGRQWRKLKAYSYVNRYNEFWKTISGPVLSPGIIGGSIETVMDITNKMNAEFLEINNSNNKKNNNMAVFNYVCYKYFKDKIVTGFPICSDYKKFQSDRKDVWFIHK